MSDSNIEIKHRAQTASAFAGMLRVVLFNWPVYSFVAIFAVGSIALAVSIHQALLRDLLIFSACVAAWQAMASLLASHWVYDRSSLKDGVWLEHFSLPPDAQIVSVHSGYDEIGDNLQKRFAGHNIATVDLFPALGRRGFSINMANKAYPPSATPISTSVSDWPINQDSVDLILIAFAAHELRLPGQKELLFKQAASVLKPDGQIVLVEHLRDWPNFLAFGPGFVHFSSQGEWLRCITAGGLKIAQRYSITSLVGVFVLCI